MIPMRHLVLATILFFSYFNVWAQSTGGGSSSRPWLLSSSAAARESKRFTLQEWLENRDRRALMDMWLSLNTPSPYEFILSGSMFHYSLENTISNSTTTKTIDGYSAELSAYARFVGVTAEYTNNTQEGFNDVTGIFNLRIFGQTVQGSHMTLHYGLRTRTATDASYRLNQQFAAVTLQIYLMKYFGIQGNYRQFFPYSEAHFGDTQSSEINAGAFIDFGSLRLFCDWYQEKQNSKLNGVENNYDRTGTKVGIKLYFD